MTPFVCYSDGINVKQKVAIIGGSGYVGSSLAKHFLKDFDVKVMDKKALPAGLEGKVEYVNCDVRDFEAVANGIADVDLVINTAIIQIPLINEEKELSYGVNVLGTQNICRAVKENEKTKGVILAGTWHVIGERGLKGVINEEFGFRPDKVEERARLYALSKIIQESILRFYDEMSDKVFGTIRMGTVLGEGMPEKTAANIFIERGLKGEPITPFSHSMYRPMLYVDIFDICRAFRSFASKILEGKLNKNENGLAHVVNMYHPDPITILDLAEIVRTTIIEYTQGKVNPKIEIKNSHPPILFSEEDKYQIKVDLSKAMDWLQLGKIKSPKESMEQLIKQKIMATKNMSS